MQLSVTKAIIFFVTWSNLGKLRTLQDGHHSINVDSYNVLYYIYIYPPIEDSDDVVDDHIPYTSMVTMF